MKPLKLTFPSNNIAFICTPMALSTLTNLLQSGDLVPLRYNEKGEDYKEEHIMREDDFQRNVSIRDLDSSYIVVPDSLEDEALAESMTQNLIVPGDPK